MRNEHLERLRDEWERVGFAIDRIEREMEEAREKVQRLTKIRAELSREGAEIMQGAGYADFMAESLAGTEGVA